MAKAGGSSRARLALVQQVLRSAAPGAGLVIVPGVDGRYNANSQRLVKYLLMGACGEQLVETTIGEELEPLEDCFLVIMEDGVRIFYGPAARGLVREQIATWPGLEQFRLFPADIEGDAAKAEKLKIQSFVDMVSDLPVLAFPTRSPEEENHETFPLVQAYGLEDFATGGFLSAVKTIVHVGDHLAPLWSHMDCPELQGPAAADLLMQHWGTAVRLATKQWLDQRALALDDEEHSPFEPLTSFYAFGSIRTPEGCIKDAARTGGTATEVLEGGKTILVRAEDPTSTIRASRAYFCAPQASDTSVRVYGAMVTTLHALLAQVLEPAAEGSAPFLRDRSRPRAIRRLEARSLQILNEALAADAEGGLPAATPNDLEVRFESFDLAGQRVDCPFVDGTKTHMNALHFLELRLRVAGIELSVGDTFVAPNDERVLILTEAAPKFLCWSEGGPAAVDEEDAAGIGHQLPGRRKTRCVAYFGSSMARASTCTASGNLELHERGMVFTWLGRALVLNLGAMSAPAASWNATEAEHADSTVFAVPATRASLGDALFDFHGGRCEYVAFLVSGHSDLSDAIALYRENQVIPFAGDDEAIVAIARCFARSDLYDKLDQQGATMSGGLEPELAEEKGDTAQSIEDLECRTIFVVAGTAGSGKSAVARAFATHFAARRIENELHHGIAFDVPRVRKQLAALGPRERAVLVTPGDTAPEALVSLVRKVCPDARISVTAVINAQNAYKDARRTNLLPGLLAQCSETLVRSVVLTSASLVPEPDLDDLQDLVRRWNGRAELFCVGLCLPASTPVVFDGSFWDHLSDVILHQSAQRELEQGANCADTPAPRHGQLQACTVTSSEMLLARERFVCGLKRLTARCALPELASARAPPPPPPPPPLSAQLAAEEKEAQQNSENVSAGGNKPPQMGIRAAQKLAKDKVKASAHSAIDRYEMLQAALPQGQFFCVSGVVTFVEEPRKRFSFAATAGTVRLREEDSDAQAGDGKAMQGYRLAVLFEGVAIGPHEDVAAFVREMQERVPPRLEALTEDTVPAAERAAIQKQLASEPLPDGFWFDGRSYMDHTGAPLAAHPRLEEGLRDWVATQNAHIADHNKRTTKRLRERQHTKLSCI